MIESFTLGFKMTMLPLIAMVIAQASNTMPPIIERWGISGVLMLNIWWLLADRKRIQDQAKLEQQRHEENRKQLLQELKESRMAYQDELKASRPKEK